VKIALLGQARRPPGRREIGVSRGGVPSVQLQQMRADRVQAMVLRDPFVGLELTEQLEAGPRTFGHRHRDSVIQ
jgi:hypothetical protein